MTPDIKGLVERLREKLALLESGGAKKLTINQVVGLLAQCEWEAANALERLSTPPAVPATPVAWLNPAEIRSLARKYAGDGEAAMDDQDQLDDKHLVLAEVFERAFKAIIAAAPVPTHSDVREAITEEMIERALSAWFASPPSETDQGLARSMRAALNAALSTTAQSGDQKETQFTKHKSTQNIMATILHDSDCAQHNEPAYPNGPCDCGADALKAVAETEPVAPAVYGYVYPDGLSESGTVERFGTNGREINGSRPLYAVPYYAAPPATPIPERLAVIDREAIARIIREYVFIDLPDLEKITAAIIRSLTLKRE